MTSSVRRAVLFAVLAVAAGAGCHAAGTPAATTPVSNAAAVATASAPALVSPTRVAPGGGEQPLASLSEAAAAIVNEHPGQIGVCVVLPESGLRYALNDAQPYPMASLTKLVILLTALHIRERLQLPITGPTLSLMTSMITESDNDSADDLWEAIGGGSAAQDYVDSIGIDGFAMSPTPSWGDSTATPRAIATILGKLVAGEILEPDDRALALRFLASVIPDQAWGAPLAFPKDAVVGVKNGWMPDDDGGWYVHSAAVNESDPAHPVVVVMTGGGDPLVEIAWIQTIANAAGEGIRSAVGQP